MSKLKVAVVGAGMIANAAHIPAWKDLQEDVEVVGVSSTSADRANLTAKRHGIEHSYADWQQMLDDLKPDIVSVCTPNAHHKLPAIAALRAGAHVFCEKPIATSHDDAAEMFDAAEDARKLLFINQTGRFSNAMMAAKEIVASGRLGEIYYAETAALRRRGIPTWGSFHMREHSGGGAIYDLGVHSMDRILWLMGNPKVVAVSSQTYRKFGDRDEGLVTLSRESGAPVGVDSPKTFNHREFDVEDFGCGFIRLENGATLVFRVSWAVNLLGRSEAFVAGTEGGLSLQPLRLYTNVGRYQVEIAPTVPDERAIVFAGHYLSTAHFLRVLRGAEKVIVTREEVLNVMRSLDGLYRSAAEGREVRTED